MDELIPTITRITPTLIAVCETWANPMEPDSFYDIPDYTLYRQEQNRNDGWRCCFIHTCPYLPQTPNNSRHAKLPVTVGRAYTLRSHSHRGMHVSTTKL